MATKMAKEDLNFIYSVIGFIFMILFGLIIYFTIKNNKDSFAATKKTDEYFSPKFTSDALTNALNNGSLPCPNINYSTEDQLTTLISEYCGNICTFGGGETCKNKNFNKKDCVNYYNKSNLKQVLKSVYNESFNNNICTQPKDNTGSNMSVGNSSSGKKYDDALLLDEGRSVPYMYGGLGGYGGYGGYSNRFYNPLDQDNGVNKLYNF